MSDIKNKFVDNLRIELNDANIEDKEEILNNYILQYEEKISKGLTDMEVVISLGDPSDIVDALRHASDTTPEKAAEVQLNKSVSELLNNDKQNTKQKKIKKEKTPKKKKNIDNDENLLANNPEPNIIGKKNKTFVRILLFISLVALAIIIPLALVNAGLNYLNDASFTMEVIISLFVGILCLILFVFLRKVTKLHIINSN